MGGIKRRTSERVISLESKRKSNKRAELESSSSRAIKDSADANFHLTIEFAVKKRRERKRMRKVCSLVSRAVYVGLSSAGASVPNAIMRRGSFHRNRITLVRRKDGKKDVLPTSCRSRIA